MPGYFSDMFAFIKTGKLNFTSKYGIGRFQWLKCKIRGGGTLHSGLGPWQWSCAFPYHYNNL